MANRTASSPSPTPRASACPTACISIPPVIPGSSRTLLTYSKIHLELLDRSCLDGSLNAWVGNGLKMR
jgi:hypothetical protein